MGQRSQTFIRLPFNPAKLVEEKMKLKDSSKWRNKIHKLAEAKESLQKFYSAFGNSDHPIVALHHQWMYGRSFVLSALRLLEFNKGCSTNSNPFHKDHYSYSKTMENPKELIDFLENFLNIFCDPLCKYARYGVERFWTLNYEEPEMREDFTGGDNNDGICIIDLVSNKYCFMNISEGDPTVMTLPPLKPLHAHDYLKAYYFEELTKDAIEDFDYKNYDEKKRKSVLRSNKIVNKKFIRRINKFTVLSKEEVKEMFPKVII
jgi:hypothetical protein